MQTSNQITIEIEAPDFADYQHDFLYCPQRFSVVLASTKTGKTFSHLFWLFELAHGWNRQWYFENVNQGMNFWWVAPVYDQSEIAFLRIKNEIGGTPGYRFRSGSNLDIHTPAKTIISFKSAKDPNNLYGEDVFGAVFDEFTRASVASWHALRTTLTYTKAPCKLIGNYTGASNWGVKLTKEAIKRPNVYASFKITAYDAVKAGILDPQEIEDARNDLPLSIFNALYLAEGTTDDSVLFSEKALEDMYTNDFVKPQGEKYMTADIALHGSDRFVVRVWHGWVVVETYIIDKCDAAEVEKFLKAKATLHGVPQRNIAYDADGVGAFLKGYLKNAYPFHNGAVPIQVGKDKVNYKNLKAQCFYLFADRVAKSGVYIQSAEYKEQTNLELENIRKHDADKDGKIAITPKDAVKQVLGFSPDMAESLMMREVFELPQQKKFTTML